MIGNPRYLEESAAVLPSVTYIQLTIAGNDKELVVVRMFVHGHLRKCSDNLLFRRQVCALLELEIANSSAERKIAVDSAKVDEAASRTYTRLLAFILRLVIEGERFRTAFYAEDRSRVSRIALIKSVLYIVRVQSALRTYNVDLVVCDDAHGSRAPRDLILVFGIWHTTCVSSCPRSTLC